MSSNETQVLVVEAGPREGKRNAKRAVVPGRHRRQFFEGSKVKKMIFIHRRKLFFLLLSNDFMICKDRYVF